MDSSAKHLSEAIDKLAQTAGTLVGGKTASDIASTDKYDSPEQYAEAQAKSASADASKTKAKMLLDKNQDANEKMVTNMLYRAGEGYEGKKKQEKVAQAAEQMAKAGLIEMDKDGRWVASTGTKFSDAMAVLNSGDMGRNSQVQVAGTSMNIDRDMDGNTRITATSKESASRGEDLDYSVSGYMGAVGVGVAMGAGAVGVANQYSKHLASEKIPMTMEDMHGAKPNGNGGFVDSKGNDFTLNDKGEVVRDNKVAMKDNPNYKKGFIKAGWDDFREKVSGLKESSSDESLNKTNKTENNIPPNNNTNESSQGNNKNVSQDTPPNSDTNSVPKNGETLKFIFDGVGGMKPNPNYKAESKVPKFIEGMIKKPGLKALAGAGLLAGYEAYENFTSDGFRQSVSNGISSFGNFMTTDHGPKGGSGQIPGSVGYKGTGGKSSGISLSTVADTALNAAAYFTPVASALFGSDLTDLPDPANINAANARPVPEFVKSIHPYNPNADIPVHAQKAFSTPTGSNTVQAMNADSTGSGTPHIVPTEQTAQNTGIIASNMETLSALTQSRSGGFTLNNAQGEQVSFTTGKGEGHPLQINNQDAGISYGAFSSLMQNKDLAGQFGNAIASSGLTDTEVYHTANKLLMDMTQQQKMSDNRMRVSSNASDVNRSLQHKEMLETMKGSDGEREEL